MKRREFTKFAATLGVTLVFNGVALTADSPQKKKPNILFIMTDQQHAGMMSCAGNPWVQTPAMDSLARQGARFERAYSVNPVCVPSRTGMMTGTMPSRFGMQSNADLRKTMFSKDVQEQTLGWIFRNAGYETVYGGKTHVPGKIEEYGFDVITSDHRDELAGQCVSFLKKPHDKPFLLVASFINPHDICYMAINDFKALKPSKTGAKGKPAAGGIEPKGAQDYLAASLQRPDGVSEEDFMARYCPPAPANLDPQVDAPEAIQLSLASTTESFRSNAFHTWSADRWRLHRWAYGRLTEVADREIGRVLGALREAGLEEKTLIVFSSDHGDMDGAHRLEHKSLFFEEAARVPFLVSLKGVTKPGLVDRKNLVSNGLDLIPTLCDYAGIPPPAGLLGRSVRALAEGRPWSSERPYIASETHFGRMICSGRYKYCVYETGARREQLVDLEKDPGEMKNVAEDPAYADILARHRAFMLEWIAHNQDTIASSYVIR